MTRSKPPPPGHKAIAKTAAAAFGGNNTRVHQFWDDNNRSSVALLESDDTPHPGITSYATIGVSDVPLRKDGNDIGVRAELVGACDSSEDAFANCMSTAAFFVINSKRLAAPGVIFPDVLSMYSSVWTMKHFLLLPAFLWEGRLEQLRVGELPLAWLLCVPISDAELRFALSAGVPELENRFEAGQIDMYDLKRVSVVDDDPAGGSS